MVRFIGHCKLIDFFRQVLGAFALLILLIADSSSMELPAYCRPLPHFGQYCVNPRSQASPLRTGKIIVYLRGHYEGSGSWPEARWIELAGQAINEFKLTELLEDQLADVVVVSGSSQVPFRQEVYEQLKKELKNIFPSPTPDLPDTKWELFLSAHSGGYVGLSITLQNNAFPIKELWMLDNYYSTREPVINILNTAVKNGLGCRGFITKHNLLRYQTHYAKAGCHVEGTLESEWTVFDHNGSVLPCLKAFSKQARCN